MKLANVDLLSYYQLILFDMKSANVDLLSGQRVIFFDMKSTFAGFMSRSEGWLRGVTLWMGFMGAALN